jgi:hypothetical protein
MVYAHVVNRSKRIASDLININIDEKEYKKKNR